MKVLYSWLEEFVNIDLPAEELAYKLIMSGLEVTGVEKIDDDWVFEIEVTPNRADCLSIIGIARECAVVLNKRFKPPKIAYLPRTSPAYIKENDFEIVIENKEACPRYIGRVLLNLEVQSSPDLIKERLLKIGLRPINNIVDITNYILIEWGQPMHAFDYNKLEGKKVIVRFARQGERITTLDGEERQLSLEDLVIADTRRPIALAGIMGGEETEVTEETKNVLLESAYFNPLLIRRSSLRHGLTTESSYRFERGVDFLAVETASRYAVELIRKYASKDRKKSQVLIDKSVDIIKKQIPLSTKVVLKFSEIKKVLGVMPSSFWIRRLIRNLGCEILAVFKEGLKVQAPSFRQDLKIGVDYIEEVARFYGYDKIPQKKLPALIVEKEPELNKFGEKDFEDRVRGILIKMGLREVISYAFLSQEEVEEFNFENVLSLRNPLAKSYAVLRPSILPSLLKVAQYNFNRNLYELAIFELGKIYIFGKEPREQKVLGILLSGNKYRDYLGNRLLYTFYDLKGLIESFLSCFGIKELQIQELQDILFSETCSLLFEVNRKKLAILGGLSQKAREYYDLKPEVFIAQLYLDVLKDEMNLDIHYQEPPQYPFIIRDISLLLPKRIPAGRLIELLSGRHSFIQGVELIDLYQGEQLPPDKKSITLRIKFQSLKRTLKDDEVDEIMKELESILLKEFPCQLRK